MKYAILSVVFFRLVGCAPAFKAGDCVRVTIEREFGGTFYELYKIEKVGKEEYFTVWGYSNDGINFEGRPSEGGKYIILVDKGEKIECKGRLQ